MCNEQTNPGKKLCARFLRNRQANLKHNSVQNSSPLKKRFVRKNDKESRRKNSARNSCVTNKQSGEKYSARDSCIANKQSREQTVLKNLAKQTNNPENRQCTRLLDNNPENRQCTRLLVTNKQSREQTVRETLASQTNHPENKQC